MSERTYNSRHDYGDGRAMRGFWRAYRDGTVPRGWPKREWVRHLRNLAAVADDYCPDRAEVLRRAAADLSGGPPL